MAILPETVTEGVSYLTEENSLGHAQIREVLRVHRDEQDSLRDIVEYRAKPSGVDCPWVRFRCTRKTFVGSIACTADKAMA